MARVLFGGRRRKGGGGAPESCPHSPIEAGIPVPHRSIWAVLWVCRQAAASAQEGGQAGREGPLRCRREQQQAAPHQCPPHVAVLAEVKQGEGPKQRAAGPSFVSRCKEADCRGPMPRRGAVEDKECSESMCMQRSARLHPAGFCRCHVLHAAPRACTQGTLT